MHTRGEVVRDEGGKAIRLVGTAQDVTALRHLEERLRRSQKLEAIGGLTGGVAHESNNLLMVVSANLEMLGDRVGKDDSLRKYIDAARRGAARGADLTDRLLSFARKQPL